jgi:ribulose-bisphosphate carboxylase large chain
VTVLPATEVEVSGIRFLARYRLAGSEEEARLLVEQILVEETIEFPRAYLPPGNIEATVVGRLEEFRRLPDGRHEALVSYAWEDAGRELPQLLNVLFGNVSLIPGVRLEDIVLPQPLMGSLPGPRFGREGLRRRTEAYGRPLLATALKPLGLTATALADLARDFVRGGIDIVKDDHGLADQPIARFRERVARVAEAVAEENLRQGRHALYCPNVTAPADEVLVRAELAKELGAGGLLLAPALTGFDFLRLLAADERLQLPVLAHPAFMGAFLTHADSGIAHRLLLGKLMRLIGADAVIYPNLGGRFSFRPEDCREIVRGTEEPLADVPPIFPMPGGGMTLERVPGLVAFYGSDVVLLIGGGLFATGDVRDGVERFRQLALSVSSEATGKE